MSHGIAAHDAMPGSRLEIFEGVGHFPHAEAPGAVHRVLLDFLATTEPASDPDAVRAPSPLGRRGLTLRRVVGLGSLGRPRMRSPMMLRWI